MSASDYTDWVEKPAVDNTVAGDPHDDDATYVDDLLQESQAPADMRNTGVVVPVRETPKPMGRILGGTLCWNNGAGIESDPNNIVQILPADEHRKHLWMMITSGSSASAGIGSAGLFADAKPKLMYVGQFDIGTAVGSIEGTFLPLGIPVTLDDFTGALWFRPLPVASTVRFTWAAVTAK